jgi:hypothetical protein
MNVRPDMLLETEKKKEDKGGNLVSQSIRWNLKERQMSGKMFRNLVYGLTGLMAGMSVITTIAKKKMEVALRNCSNNSLGMKDHRVYLSLGGKKLVRKRAIWKNELNPHATRHTNTQKKNLSSDATATTHNQKNYLRLYGVTSMSSLILADEKYLSQEGPPKIEPTRNKFQTQLLKTHFVV